MTSGSGKSGRKVMWLCMRSEPLVFVNRRPYYIKVRKSRPSRAVGFGERACHACLPQIREPGTGNLTDVKAQLRLQQLEKMLKDELLANAAKHGGATRTHTHTHTHTYTHTHTHTHTHILYIYIYI